MKRIFIAPAIVLTLTACDPGPQPQNIDAGIVSASTRFDVKKEAKFYDSEAYSNYRVIYVITDKKTGREYIGVSGVGVSEVGSHPTTKGQHATDER